MRNITKVPNGPLIKKKGAYAGSTLKKGGVIKKAQDGFNKIKPGTKQTTPKFRVPESRFVITNDTAKVKPTRWINNPMPPSKSKNEFPMPSEKLMDSVSKASVPNLDTAKLMKKKAQNGDTLTVKKPMTYAEKRAAQQLVKERNIRARDSVLNRNAAARGMTREEVRAQQEKDKKKPNAALPGLQTKEACKRGESKGSCTTGQTNKGESLKDTKRNGGTIKKAQGGKLLRKLTDKIVSKESNRMVDRVVKRPAGMTNKPVDYGKVVLTDAQKAKNAEILKNPGTATAESWKRARNIAKKESRAQSNAEYLERSNKPMVTRPGSPKISTLARAAKSINKKKAGGMIKRADGSYSQRGLWDNLRSKAAQNKKTGAKPKAPTKAMLTQEKKIKSKGK